jgi:hypothetical protein
MLGDMSHSRGKDSWLTAFLVHDATVPRHCATPLCHAIAGRNQVLVGCICMKAYKLLLKKLSEGHG